MGKGMRGRGTGGGGRGGGWNSGNGSRGIVGGSGNYITVTVSGGINSCSEWIKNSNEYSHKFL